MASYANDEPKGLRFINRQCKSVSFLYVLLFLLQLSLMHLPRTVQNSFLIWNWTGWWNVCHAGTFRHYCGARAVTSRPPCMGNSVGWAHLTLVGSGSTCPCRMEPLRPLTSSNQWGTIEQEVMQHTDMQMRSTWAKWLHEIFYDYLCRFRYRKGTHFYPPILKFKTIL